MAETAGKECSTAVLATRPQELWSSFPLRAYKPSIDKESLSIIPMFSFDSVAYNPNLAQLATLTPGSECC